MEIDVVDAFSAQPFGGNQAGVVMLEDDFPPEEWMRALAGELRYSETAFVRCTAADCFQIRYFTPAGEVDLCGHATVGAFTALRETGRITPGHYRLNTQSGALEIAVERDMVWMDMAPPEEAQGFTSEETEELYTAYGLTAADGAEGLSPQVVSTGLRDIMLPVKDKAVLDRAVQDEAAVMALSRRYKGAGVHMFCLEDGSGITARCRNFAPLYAIPEEAATGTANGALTFYLYRRGVVMAGAENRFFQGEAMGRPSEIFSRLILKDGAPLVRIGGRAVLILRGQWAGGVL